ncbi:MAG: MlaD family protein [Burkholderiales bacterium]
MSTSIRHFKLGLFVLGAAIVFIAIVLIVGSGSFGRARVKMETYFNESVQGLDIGSKVKYRGVSVGEVTRITFSSTRYEQDKPPTERKQYVLVETALDPQIVSLRLGSVSDQDKIFKQQIERGLRVRLNPQGITGTSYLEIDFLDPAANRPLAIDWIPEHLYVPSAPSTVKQFVDAASDLLNELRHIDLANMGLVLRETISQINRLATTANTRLEKLPVDQLARDATALINEIRGSNTRLSNAVTAFPAEAIGRDFSALMVELRESNQRLGRALSDPQLAKLPEQASAMIETTNAAFGRMRAVLDNPDLGRTLTQLQRSVGRLERVLVGREGDIATTLENLRIISDNLRDATENAKNYPSQIILGEPPAAATSPRR